MFETADAFRNYVIDRMLQASLQIQTDNFDAERFAGRQWNEFDPAPHREYLLFFLERPQRYFEIWQLLENEASRSLFIELILFRLLGHLHVKLPSNTADFWDKWERGKRLPASDSSLDFRFWRGPLQHFEFDYDGERFNYEGAYSNLSAAFFVRQYFYQHDNVRIQPEAGDVALDCGACFGNTSLVFAHHVGPQGRVYSFDFMPNHLELMAVNRQQNPRLAERIINVPYGVAAQTANLDVSFQPQTDKVMPGARLDMFANQPVPTIRIDDLVAREGLRKVDFIKMDIEGAEAEALQGAEATIRRFRPKLAICIYHRKADYFKLPAMIKTWVPEYRIYLDHYSIHAEETVLYATARD